MNTALSTQTNITIDDLVKAGGGTPDKSKPWVPDQDAQYRVPRKWLADPEGSKKDYAETVDSVHEIIEHVESFEYGFDDVAVNLWRVMQNMEGGVVRSLKSKPGQAVPERTVNIGYDSNGHMQRVTIPSEWMTVPSAHARVMAVRNRDGSGSVAFQFPRVEHEVILGILAYLRAYIENHSIYRGQCITEEYEYVNVTQFDGNKLVYNEDIEDLLSTWVVGPLRYGNVNEQAGLSTKVSTCLAGRPGTGKTMFIANAQHINFMLGGTSVAVTAGTGIAGIHRGVKIMRTYMQPGKPSLLTFEDIETLASSERTKLLELFDGAAGKSDRAVLLTTTNFPDRLEPAMLRPGRIDQVIPIELPDRGAFERLVKVSLGDKLDPDVDFDEAFPYFEGYSSAWIVSSAQVVVRSAIARTGSFEALRVSTRDLIAAANGYRFQFQMQQDSANREPKPITIDDVIGELTRNAIEDYLNHNYVGTHDTTDYDVIADIVSNRIEDKLNSATIELSDANGDDVSGTFYTN